ncbi:MAG: hypothetical protein GX633_07280 [Clostridiales bacterium]|nr:hypothetical protein [Clostridiales bacterium]
MIKVVILLTITAVGVTTAAFGLGKEVFPLPIGVRHLINTIIAPKDLYDPIVEDRFVFYLKGYEKVYDLKPKYLDVYELGFSAGDSGIDSRYRFKGCLRAVFYSGNKAIYECLISSQKSAWYIKEDMTRYRSISLLTFDVPIKGKYVNDLKVKLTVLEPDVQLEKYRDQIKLHIAVSGIP